MRILDFFGFGEVKPGLQDSAIQRLNPVDRRIRESMLRHGELVSQRSIFAEGVLRLDMPLDVDRPALVQRIHAISSLRPWIDDLWGREKMNIGIEIHTNSGTAEAWNEASLLYDPTYVQVTFSHGCYHLMHEEQVKAYMKFILFMGTELRHTFPGISDVKAFVQTREKIAEHL